MPAPCRRFLAVPHPDPPMRDIDPQRAACALAQGAAGPIVRGEACDQAFHCDAVHGGLLLAGRTSLAFGFWGGEMQPPRVAPDPLVAMNIGNEDLTHVVERAQEGRLLAVAAVHSDPAEPHPPRPRRTHQLKCKISLRAHPARLWRDLGAVAAGRVIDPALRQVEPHVDRRVPRPIAQHREHRPLAVVHLAQPPAPLPGHTNRAIALLDEAALVDDQRAVRLAAQQVIAITSNLLNDRLVPPRRVADEGLERLLAAVLNHGGHRRERGRLRLREAMQVALGHRRVVVPAAAEEPAVAVDEACERIRDAIDQRSGQRASAHTVTRRTDALISPLPVRMSWNLSDSACNPDVKGRFRAVRTTSGLAVAVPHAAVATSASHSDGTFRLA